jgi:hypothetical protein
VFICDCGLVQHESPPKKYPLLRDVIDRGVYGPKTDGQASIQWITTTEQIQKLVAGLDKQRLSENSLPLKDINLDRCWVLLIEMGQKPTGGYSVSLNKQSSYFSDKPAAVICLNWDIPDQDAVLTQVLTSPYLILKLAKGNFTKVVVLDQENRTLFEAHTPR